MSANTTLRLASLTSAAYGVLLVSGMVHHFQRTGSFRALAHGLAQPVVLVTLAIVLLLVFGLWRRYAWAWWLGIGAAGYQLYRLVTSYFLAGRMPHFSTLLALALVVLLLVLLFQRSARAGANR